MIKFNIEPFFIVHSVTMQLNFLADTTLHLIRDLTNIILFVFQTFYCYFY